MRWTIWGFALFVILLTWLAPVQRYRFERGEAIQRVIDENTNRAIMLEQYATRTLEAADIATLHIAERLLDPDSVLARGTPGRPAPISGPIAQNRSFLGISVVDARGDLIASTLRNPAPINVRDRAAFRVHLADPRPNLFVSRPGFAPTFNRQVLWLSRRVDDADGRLAFVIAVNLAPEALIGFSDGVDVQPTDVVSIIGLDGITRARRTGRRFSTGEDLSGMEVMRRQQASPVGSYVGPGALDGLVRYYSQRRLSNYPLFATYGVLQEEILEPVRHRFAIFAIVASLVTACTLGFALILTWLLGRSERSATQLAETNRRLEGAQRVARMGDWSFDLATRRITWSPIHYEMYERDPAQGPPSIEDFTKYLEQESQYIVQEAIEQAVRTKAPEAYDLTVKLPSGAIGHRLVNVIPTLNEAGDVVALHGTEQDISERKKLDQLEAAVAHLSRHGAMNAMASTLAHELNQPLAAASNYLGGAVRMMESGVPNHEMTAEGIRAARDQVQFAGEIIRRVRAMVANEPRRLAPVQVSRIIDDALALSLSGAEAAGISVHRKVAIDSRTILADAIQIEQVLLNLIRNAREATANVAEPRISISASRLDARFVQIAVEDNGSGFEDGPEGYFFSASASSKPGGLGLGLSISRTIVESHGGRIWAENRNGSGARVTFTIPSARMGEAEPSPT